jgi:uncharacterized membrane protein
MKSTGMVGLGTLGSQTAPHGAFSSSEAHGISGDGSVIVGESTAPVEGGRVGFRWMEKTGMRIFIPGNPHCIPRAVSFDGSVVIGGGCRRAEGTDPYGFVWDAVNGLRDIAELLERSGIDIGTRRIFPRAISDDGRTVVGEAWSRRWAQEGGWVARLPMTPRIQVSPAQK